MKKVHIISLIAIITITCLQGFNIFLQYKNYAFEEMDKINETLYSSIDEELNLRNRKAIQPDKLGEQHFIYKECTPNERNITNGDKEIDLRVFDAKELKRKGLIRSSTDILNLTMQDHNLEKGNDINLSTLDTVFTKNLKTKYKHIIYLLDNKKKHIKFAGCKEEDISNWHISNDVAVNLAKPRFIRVAILITPSQFIIQSFWALVLSVLFVIIAAICIGYQLREIKKRDELLKSRALTVNSIIHDLKSPINSIIALMGVIKLKIMDEPTKRLTGQIINKSKLLVNDIETILSTASDRRRIILNPEKVDVVELANQAKSDIDIIYKDKEHTITINNNDVKGDSIINADKMYLLNVIRNLMENAVKYADKGVIVNISIKKDSNGLEVCIADNGWGISKKDQKLIFKQFYRVPHEHGPRGHGIGLALVKYVVESHGGHILVKSEVGKGSKFIFNIPSI